MKWVMLPIKSFIFQRNLSPGEDRIIVKHNIMFINRECDIVKVVLQNMMVLMFTYQ